MSDSSPNSDPFRVVAIGASAGGLEACQKLLDGLPSETRIAILIVHHLDPDHESALVDLLSRHTRMKVSQAEHGATISPGHIYVIPPGRQISVNGERLEVEPFKTKVRPRLPFDHLLVSMAKELGSRAVAVVLSGTGSDGSVGIRDIRREGGVVLVQEPSEAAFDGMPRSAIETGKVTHVAKLEGLVGMLTNVDERVQPVQLSVEVDHEAINFHKIINLLLTSKAHDFRSYKTGTLQRRIKRRLEACEKAEGSIEKYFELLEGDPAELDSLAQDLLINVTEFFRDPLVFQQLEAEVIPKIVREKTQGLPIRIWVPGCSTGQEAYSLAILFHEALASEGSKSTVQIFASDADPEAVAEAREGIYRDIKGLNDKRLERFFRHEDGGWRVTPDLRVMVTFTVHDLLSDPPFLRLDMVSCRNLLIYLKPEAQQRLMALFSYALVADGILLLGAAETVGHLDERFTVLSEAARIYRKKQTSRISDVMPLLSPHDAIAPVGGGLTLRQRPFDPGELLRTKVLEGYATATALVNADFECLYMLGPADQYFRVSPGRPGNGLLTMARDGVAVELRKALEEAVRTNEKAVVTGGHVRGGGATAGFSVSVQPINYEGQKLYIVSLSPAVATAEVQTSPGPFNGQVIELERELDETRAELGKVLRELQQVSSMEYTALAEAKSVQEEYQASNEELLSSKEELQSLNEELNALNVQLQSTLERERGSANDLQNILFSTDTATLFLDSKFLVRFFTPGIAALFKLRPVDIGRPLEELTLFASDTALFDDIKSAFHAGTRMSADVQTQTGTWFNRSALPYRTREGQIDGVIITLDDITERKRHEKDLEAQKASAAIACMRLESAIGSLPDAFAYYDPQSVLVLCNTRYRDLHSNLGHIIGPGLHFEQLVPPGRGVGTEASVVDDYVIWIAKRALHRKPVEDIVELRLADGRWFNLIDTPTPDGGWVNMLIDITRLKNVEQQLSERASAIAGVNEGVAITDAAHNLTYMNDACRTMFGVTKEPDYLGRSWLHLFSVKPGAYLKSVNAALLRDGVWRGSLTGIQLDGGTFDVDVSLTLMHNGNLVIIARDVSKRNADQRDRDKLREQLLVAQRREIVNVVAAGLAHDLNNLLAVISGSVEMLLGGDEQGDPPKQEAPAIKNRLRNILRATDQSSELLKRLIKLGGRELARKKFDMRQAVQEAVDLISVGLPTDIDLAVHMPSTAVEILADPVDVLQIVLNLGLNARDALGEGAQKINVSLSRAKPAQKAGPFDIGEVEVGSPHVCLMIADTGSGMNPTVRASIFDAYYSTKGAAGTGLGLPMVKEIVTSYGGGIKVESTVGQGTTFTVLLPVKPHGYKKAKQAQIAKHTATTNGAGPLNGHVALVVDDNDEFRDLISSFLEDAGSEVIVCADPLEALEALHEAPMGCDVLITDFDMPHMNGLQLAEAAARLAPNLPVIMVTASNQLRNMGILLGNKKLFHAVLHKPIKRAQIVNAVTEVLRKPKAKEH